MPRPKNPLKETLREKDLEIRRLQEQLDIAKEKAGSTERQTVASSMPIADLRDRDFVHLQTVVETMPAIYEAEGLYQARHFAQQTVMAALLAIDLKPPASSDLVIAQHRVLQMLGDGAVDVMFRRDRQGQTSRNAFLTCVVRYFLRPAYKAAFEKTVPEPYIPPEYRQGGHE